MTKHQTRLLARLPPQTKGKLILGKEESRSHKAYILLYTDMSAQKVQSSESNMFM